MKRDKLFEEAMERYLLGAKINIADYLSRKNLAVLKRLGIAIEDRLYTEDEFRAIEEELYTYYSEPGDPELMPLRSLSEKNVTDEEYRELIDIFLKISDEYD